jgi:hypothetical protein
LKIALTILIFSAAYSISFYYNSFAAGWLAAGLGFGLTSLLDHVKISWRRI